MKNDLSGEPLESVRPCNRTALPENDLEDEHCKPGAQGELGAVDADEDCFDWDDQDEESGVVPRVPKDVYTPQLRHLKSTTPPTYQRDGGVRHASKANLPIRRTAESLNADAACLRWGLTTRSCVKPTSMRS